ncbi:hypothetical protein EVAR_278_1 [Eumeta japonica]|uniref:Uncharacterized protein n=1 Tax=Eumeta variegata TaxID=151549 RepID=A0A4C1S9I5_EUMVA|nr:hypothetical protein EVAR_278_1 [Eumeta japonica]
MRVSCDASRAACACAIADNINGVIVILSPAQPTSARPHTCEPPTCVCPERKGDERINVEHRGRRGGLAGGGRRAADARCVHYVMIPVIECGRARGAGGAGRRARPEISIYEDIILFVAGGAAAARLCSSDSTSINYCVAARPQPGAAPAPAPAHAHAASRGGPPTAAQRM